LDPENELQGGASELTGLQADASIGVQDCAVSIADDNGDCEVPDELEAMIGGLVPHAFLTTSNPPFLVERYMRVKTLSHCKADCSFSRLLTR